MISKRPAPIVILKPSIDDAIEPNVIRGIIDTKSLIHLNVDASYQRERLTPGSRREIVRALDMGKKLPDIELGMRGEHFGLSDDAQVLELLDPTYIIDGYQRSETVKEHCERNPDEAVRLGAVIHLNTNQQYERERFQALNMFRTKVSASVLLRNTKEENHLMAQLYGITKGNQKTSVMYGKVCWSQNQTQGELITALTFCQVASLLHSHISPASTKTSEIPDSFNRLERAAGLPLFRANVLAFWDLMNDAWGIVSVTRQGPVVHCRSSFLRTLARILSDHREFWTPQNRLVISSDIRRKLARLPMNDPEILRLSGAGGKAIEALYYILVSHINSGKRTKRLTHRYGNIVPPAPEVDDESESENA